MIEKIVKKYANEKKCDIKFFDGIWANHFDLNYKMNFTINLTSIQMCIIEKNTKKYCYNGFKVILYFFKSLLFIIL